MKQQFFIILICLFTTSLYAQKELKMSQYMYNKYVMNPAFGGYHEVLSLYSSFRKQWLGFDNSPKGAFFSMHSPLKNEKIALGIQFFNEKIAITHNAGFNISYAYRVTLQNKAKLAFGISAGMVNYKSNWNEVILVDAEDHVFDGAYQSSAPWLGFGVGIYDHKYFAGFSIPSFIFYDRYEAGENVLDFSKIDYLVTGGYLFNLSEDISLQPSVLIRINPNQKTYFDFGATTILMRSFIVGVCYRTTNEITGIVGYQITPQFRFTYSLDYDIDPIGSYNSGTHEIAIQFDFGYKINSPNPKFF